MYENDDRIVGSSEFRPCGECEAMITAGSFCDRCHSQLRAQMNLSPRVSTWAVWITAFPGQRVGDHYDLRLLAIPRAKQPGDGTPFMQLGSGFLELPLQRLSFPGCRPYFEIRWDAEHGCRESFSGASRGQEHMELWRASRDLLMPRPPRGRPRLMDHGDLDRIRQTVDERRDAGLKLTQVDVAGDLEMTVSTLKRRLADHEVTWAEIRAANF